MSVEEGQPDEPLVEPLTRRESEILGLLDQGFSAPEMAEQLTLAVSSVKWHIQHIYDKLGVSGKRQALNRAQALGLLGEPAAAAGAIATGAAAAAIPAPSPASPTPAPAPDAELWRPAPGESPFKGLRHFDEADEAWFFGREALAAALVARLAPAAGPGGKSPARFLAVVGASGSGKSSIVRAGVIPALRRAEGARFEPIHLLTPTAHPLEALAVALTRAGESVTATATLMDDLARDERALHLYARRLMSAADGGVQPNAPTGVQSGAGVQPNAPTNNRGRLLLVVDQFEELFTLCRGEAERQAFINNLLRAAAPEGDGPVTVLITLRADFYPACAVYAGLREALASQQAYIGPMNADELRQAVERPAELGGWEFEPGLVDLILRDVSGAPGALPLLSHALLETWRHRRGRTLTLRSYAESGRVQGAIATTAEAVFQSMPPEEQAITRGVFLRLTELGEGTQDTRRRVALAELLPAAAPGDGAAASAAGASAEIAASPVPGGAVAAVLQILSEARLITQEEGVVEVAHEALIREWPTLRQWLNEDRDALRLHRRLTEAAQEWDELERDPSELYRGPRLAQAMDWEAGHAGDLNPLEAEFIEASLARVEHEAEQLEAQRQRELEAARGLAEAQRQRAEAEAQRAAEQAQAANRLRARNRVITAVGVLALLAALAAGFFGLEANRNVGLAQEAGTQSAQNLSAAQAAGTQAISQRDEARKQTSIAYANQLAAQAISVLPTSYSLALLLGVEANRAADDALTRQSLHSVLVYSPHLLGYLYSLQQPYNLAYSPDGTNLASAGGPAGAYFQVWNVTTHQVVATPQIAPNENYLALTYSSGGKTLLESSINGSGGSISVWDIATGPLHSQPLAGDVRNVTFMAFSPDGARLAAGSTDNLINIWDVATGQAVGQPLTGHTGPITNVAFSPDGKTLASASQDGTVRLWDVASGQQQGAPLTEPLIDQPNRLSGVTFSPDGKTLAWVSSNGDVLLADLTATPPGAPVRLNGPTAAVISLAFSRDSKLLATGSADHTLRLWNVANRLTLGPPLIGHNGPVTTIAFSPDGKTLASAGEDYAVILWQISDSLLSLAVEDPVVRACQLAGRNLTRAEWAQNFAPQTYRKTCDQWPDGN